MAPKRWETLIYLTANISHLFLTCRSARRICWTERQCASFRSAFCCCFCFCILENNSDRIRTSLLLNHNSFETSQNFFHLNSDPWIDDEHRTRPELLWCQISPTIIKPVQTVSVSVMSIRDSELQCLCIFSFHRICLQ